MTSRFHPYRPVDFDINPWEFYFSQNHDYMFRTRRFSKLNLVMFTCIIRKHYHEHINQSIYMIRKSSFSRRRNKFRSNLIFHFWAYPNPKANVACGLCPQPENLDMGPSSHLLQNCLEPCARQVRRGLDSQTYHWAQEIWDRLDKRNNNWACRPKAGDHTPEPNIYYWQRTCLDSEQ